MDGKHPFNRMKIVPNGIIHPSKPTYVSAKNFTDAWGYWNYRGGILICWLRDHRWKWVRGSISLKSACWGWDLQCTRCRRIERSPEKLDKKEIS